MYNAIKENKINCADFPIKTNEINTAGDGKMSRILRIVTCTLALALLCGCASVNCGKSSVRFALVDIDLRDKDQIAASVAAENDQPQPREMSVGWWDGIVQILGALKGRIRVGAYESIINKPCCTNSVDGVIPQIVMPPVLSSPLQFTNTLLPSTLPNCSQP